jgi:hypothetical protein
MSLSYRKTPVHHERLAALRSLLNYAHLHRHRRLSIGPLTFLLQREGERHA